MIAEAALHHDLDPGGPAELPDRRPRRQRRARRSRSAGPVGPRGRGSSFRGKFTPTGVRREPRGDAPRPGRTRHGDRCAHADDSIGTATGAAPSRSGVSIPRLRPALHAGASHPTLGKRRAHDAVESRAAMPASPSLGTRGWLSSRTPGGRRARIPAPRWPCATQRAGTARSARLGGGAARAERRGRPRRLYAEARVVWRSP